MKKKKKICGRSRFNFGTIPADQKIKGGTKQSMSYWYMRRAAVEKGEGGVKETGKLVR